jgi:predicted site-specific integrase-resolvase
MTLHMKEPLLSSGQFCELTGISRATLTQWIVKGWAVPVQKLPGGAYLFELTEPDRALRRRAAAREGAA